jgi:hypothetical protein
MNTSHYYQIHRTARCCTARLKSDVEDTTLRALCTVLRMTDTQHGIRFESQIYTFTVFRQQYDRKYS